MADEIYVCKQYEESKIVNCTTTLHPDVDNSILR